MTIYRSSIPSALNDMVFYFPATTGHKTLTLFNSISVCSEGRGGQEGGVYMCVYVGPCVVVGGASGRSLRMCDSVSACNP